MSIERLTPNSARTVRTYSLGQAKLLASVGVAVQRLPRWRVESVDSTGLKAVRTTRLLRFEDDVAVLVSAHGGITRAEFTSASRVGNSDLGQNPRNLQELLDSLDHVVDTGSDPTASTVDYRPGPDGLPPGRRFTSDGERGDQTATERAGGEALSKDAQKRIVVVLATALAAWTATKLAGSFLDEPEERGVRDDVKEALLQGTFSVVFTVASSLIIRHVLSKRWGS